MELNRHEKLKFLIKGRVVNLECLFWGTMLDRVPTYVSRGIRDIALLETADNSIFLIMNDDYYKNNKEEADIKIYNALLKKYYNNVDKICDVYTAMAFGFTKTINMVKSYGVNGDARAKYLENIFRNRDKLKIKRLDIQDILSSYKFVSVK